MAAWALGLISSLTGDYNRQQTWHFQVYIKMIFLIQLIAKLPPNLFNHLIYWRDGLPFSLSSRTIELSGNTQKCLIKKINYYDTFIL